MDKEEALGILKDLYEKSIFSERKALETFVPELKKSEDEKIKTFIRGLLLPHISYIHLDGDKIMPNKDIDKYRKALAWLDKQESVEEIVKKCKNSWYNEGKIAGQAEGLTNDERYWQGYHDALEKQGEFPATISVDKMVEEFEDFKVMAGRIPSLAEIDAYRKGVTDVLSKVLIKEEKPITIGSKKAEGKLGEMIAASKKPAGSGEEDKQLTYKEVTKKSEQDKEIENPDDIIDEYHQQQADDLIDMVTEKSTWSEEDEENYRNATTIISRQKLNAYTIEMMNDCSRCIKWLSSIKERMN